MTAPTPCPVCNGLGFLIVYDRIDTGNDAYCPEVQFPDYCPGKCCTPQESEARFKAWEKERVA